MSYKTILVHVDDARNAGARYAIAAELAQAEQAHLIGMASSDVSRFLRETVAVGFGAPAFLPYFTTLRERASGVLDEFERVAAGFVLAGVERRMVDDGSADCLSALARYCDVCVLGQSDPAHPPSGLVADVAKASGCPVLVVPVAGASPWPMRRILLAWNGSRESARAMRLAMPLLRRAEAVDVAIFNDAAVQAGPELPAASAIGQALARHGVRAAVLARENDDDIGLALLALAGERDAQLLVMGCYGHSRARELLLGGATRTVLRSMTLPVFMAS